MKLLIMLKNIMGNFVLTYSLGFIMFEYKLKLNKGNKMKLTIFHDGKELAYTEGEKIDIIYTMKSIQSHIKDSSGFTFNQGQGSVFISQEAGPIMMLIEGK